MRALRAIVLALLSFAVIAAASAAGPPRPSCGGMFHLCGYLDAAGSEVIAQRFEEARPFQSGLAAVRVEGLWGFIDALGDIVIEPRFQMVGSFQGTRAEVALDGRVGVIDREGSFVIPPRFARAIPFTEDIALVSEPEDPAFEHILRLAVTDVIFGEFRLFHRRDGWLTETPRKFRWFAGPRKGRASFIWATGSSTLELYGLMDERGNWVVQPRFGYVQALHNGRAVVRDPHGQRLSGAVDETGRIVIPLEHDWLSAFQNGYAIIGGPGSVASRKKGLLRSDGIVVAEPIFEDAVRPEQGGVPRVKRDGIWYSVERPGALVPAAEYNEPDGHLIASCPQGLRIERQGSGYLLKDAEGRPSLSGPVDHVSFGIPNERGAVSLNSTKARELHCGVPISVAVGGLRDGTSRWTYVRPDGRPLFEPPRFFPTVYRFVFGHASIGTARRGEVGEWGIIDMEGRFTLPMGPKPVFPAPGGISRLVGQAIFRLGDGDDAQLVDVQGRRVPDVETALDRAKRQRVLRCGNGVHITGDGERFGLVGPDGEILVPAIHRAIGCFRNGVAWAPRDDLRRWCPIGPDGTFRDAPACVPAFYPAWISHHAPERFVEDAYDNSVIWVRGRLRYGMGLREKAPCWVSTAVKGIEACSKLPFGL